MSDRDERMRTLERSIEAAQYLPAGPAGGSLASECTEILVSRPLDGASAGGMPVGRVEFSLTQPATRRVDWPFPNAEERGTAYLDAEIERLNASLRAEGAAGERERIRLELVAEAEKIEEQERQQPPLGLDAGPGMVACRAVMLGGAKALRDFARRLEPR